MMDKAILIGIDDGLKEIEYSLLELENLAKTLKIETIGKFWQKRPFPNPKTYLGKGKIAEVKNASEALDADIVIFNDELTPSQIRTLEKYFNTQIVDRSFLILSIFSERAETKGAYLEVSLAQQKYLLPRLVGMRDSLSRQGGGTYNAKGPGETKLELDRRTILRTIKSLEKDLKKWEKENTLNRKKRTLKAIPIVSLVGYTNAGKSATLNSLLTVIESDKRVFEKDVLFATLRTHTRKIKKKGYPAFILTDTIGFIDKLPHAFVNAFKATLYEVSNSDLILNIIDGSDPKNYLHQITTNQVLKELAAENIPTLEIYTKLDLLKERPLDENLWISNLEDTNLDALLHLIYENLFGSSLLATLEVPYQDQGIIALINDETRIIKTSYTNNSSLYEVIIFRKQLESFKDYLIKTKFL